MKNRKISSADKILFVSSYNLYKRFGGGLATLAFFQATNALFPEKVDIILPKESYESNKSNYFKAPKRNKIMAAILLIFGRLHRYRNYVSLHLKQYHGRYKWCVINGGIYAGDMIKRIKSYGIKVIVIHHNYEKEYHSDNKTLVSFYGKFPYYVIRNERNAYHQADLNLFLTKSDMESFVENYGECKSICCVIGMFEYEYRTVQFIKEIKLPHKIIITGSMNHNQTISGITDFY
jgi:hypothetical protein